MRTPTPIDSDSVARWLIEGELEATTPCHAGAGESTREKGLSEAAGTDVLVRRVATDVDSLPMIPGSSLKGVLWREVRNVGAPENTVTRLFGKAAAQGDMGEGGCAQFWDARWLRLIPDLNVGFLPHWNPSRRTGITASAPMDRETGTAAARRLHNEEYVPPGTVFRARFSFLRCRSSDVAWLLAALDGFTGGSDSLSLAAHTHNEFGRFRWRPTRVLRLGTDEITSCIRTWIEDPIRLDLDPDHATNAWTELASAAWPRRTYEPGEPTAARATADTLEIPLRVRFLGPFLVQQRGRPQPDGKVEVQAMPHVDAQGRIVLPCRSWRGVLRQRAEFILRSMVEDPDVGSKLAPDPNGSPQEIRRGESNEVSLVHALFGGRSWGTCVSGPPFLATGDVRLVRQDFIAVDRWHGGGAIDRSPNGAVQGRKFDALAAECPVLLGAIRIDVGRMKREFGPEVAKAALGLFCLVLRDAGEGDLYPGSRSGKGHGECRFEPADGSGSLSALVPNFSDCLGGLRKHVARLVANPTTPGNRA